MKKTIILVAGGTHTGKTLFAQKLLEKYHYPYLSIDHLKMGLIRSGYCPLTPESNSADLTRYLWPVIKDIMKTVIENQQNLIIEGCYIPFDYQKHFESDYLREIRYICLVFSENYIHQHFADITGYAHKIEYRMGDDSCSRQMLLEENVSNLELCKKHGLNYVLFDDQYKVTWDRALTTVIFETEGK